MSVSGKYVFLNNGHVFMSVVLVVAGGECTNCVDEGPAALNRWTMPLLKLGEKRYYLGIFFKVSGQLLPNIKP